MRTVSTTIIALSLVGVVHAKFPYKIEPSYWSASNFANAEIQKDLKLPAAKVAQVAAVQQEYWDKARKLEDEVGENPTDAQALAYFDKAQVLDNWFIAKIWALTTEKERERLEQIRLQQFGAKALVEPGVSGYLKLTASQLTLLNSIREAAQTEFRAVQTSMREADKTDWNELRKLRETLRVRVNEQSMAVLQPDQTKKYTALIGVPFGGKLPSTQPNF